MKLDSLNILIIFDENRSFLNYSVLKDIPNKQPGHSTYSQFEPVLPVNGNCPTCFNDFEVYLWTEVSKKVESFDVKLESIPNLEESQVEYDDCLKSEEVELDLKPISMIVVDEPAKNSIQNPHQKLEERSLLCKKCDKTFKNAQGLSRHMTFCYPKSNLKNPKELNCDICEKKCRNKTYLNRHIEVTHGTKNRFKCPINGCTKNCWSRLELEEHLVRHEIPKPYICDICGSEYTSRSNIIKHMNKCHNQSRKFLTCNLCKKNYAYQSQYNAHIKSVHSGIKRERIYSCPKCDKKFTAAKSVEYHIRNIHEKNLPYCCELCGQGCTSAWTYNDHMKKHEDPKPYSCDYCMKKFTSKHWVRKHMQVRHLNISDFVCSVCGKKFETTASLESHQLRHTKVKSEKCPHCTSTFYEKTSVNKHIKRKHTAIKITKKYACDRCDFITTEQRYLKKHHQVHLDNSEKPFHCQYCEKGFGNIHNKNRHEMTHTNQRPVICPICSKNFRSNADLKDHHLREHSNEKPYICEICQQGYADRGSYRSHLIGHEKQLGIILDKSIKKFSKNIIVFD